jgi:hypothetical protein
MMLRAMLVAAIAFAECRAADLFPVAGTIVNTVTNSPLPRAYVFFYNPNSTTAVARAITGTDGRFQFQLPAGSYRMLAGTRDTWENYGSRTPGTVLGSAVIVGPGKATANIVFRYFPPAAISGRILDESGDPAPNVLVQLIRANVVNGFRAPAIYAFLRTDDLGDFRFDRLPGNVPYYLAVTGEPWYTQPSTLLASLGGTPDPPGAHAAAAYAPLYYPNAADPAKAAPIVVKPGEEARADFRLTTVLNGSVTIRHNGPPGLKGTVTLTYNGVAGTVATQQVQQLAVGFLPPLRFQQERAQEEPAKPSQSLQGVPAGHYNVTVNGTFGGSVLTGTAPVDVNASDVTVDFTLKAPPKIEGVVHLVPGARQTGAMRVSIRGEISGQLATVPVKNDGTFSFPAVQPGHFRFGLASQDGFFASRIEAQGGRIEDDRLEVEDRDVSLAVTASNAVGQVRGFVVDDENPVEGALVVLYAAPGRSSASGSDARYRSFQTESDGSFDFRSVPAGRYFLFAVNDSELEYGRPDVVAPYLRGAKEIDVGLGNSTDVRISMTLPSADR